MGSRSPAIPSPPLAGLSVVAISAWWRATAKSSDSSRSSRQLGAVAVRVEDRLAHVPDRYQFAAVAAGFEVGG
jgi:hypothetical protein